MFKKNKNILDEMQEQKLLKIEHKGVWLVFWGLLAAIIIQFIWGIGQKNLFQTIAGEQCVFFCLCVYMTGSSLINGIWDRNFRPKFKTNLIISLIAGMITGILFFFTTLYKYQKLAASITTSLIMFVTVFILALSVISILAVVYRKRVSKFEKE